MKQTFTDWELIIYNDGSSDNGKTSKFLDQINKLDSRIIFIDSIDNHGLAYAKNQLLAVAAGKYITAQDDDVSEFTRLEKEVKFLDNNTRFDFVGTLASLFDKDGKWGHYKLPQVPDKNDFLWNSPFLNPSMMFRANVLKDVKGFRVASETKRAEDYDLFFRLYAKGYKGYNIQKKLFNYRIEIEEEKNKKYRPIRC